MKDLLKIATAELGVSELEGNEHNPRILQYAREVDLDWYENDETAWCSIFINWVAMKAKFIRSKKPNARSWLNVGFPVENPEPGDIVVYWRGSKSSWKGHVGIFLGFDQSRQRIYTLGGNQGDSVSISGYSVDRLLEFRRLIQTDIRLTNKILKKGSHGKVVAALQDALKMAGFNCGTSDGFFGAKTETAIRGLQEYSEGELVVNGIFNAETKTYLKELINEPLD